MEPLEISLFYIHAEEDLLRKAAFIELNQYKTAHYESLADDMRHHDLHA